MNVLIVHNRYQGLGGEDTVVKHEQKMLEEMGCIVHLVTRKNTMPGTARSKFLAASNTFVNRDAQRWLSGKISQHKPDIVHFHNTFGNFGSSVFEIPHRMGVPSILTAHNYRLFCINGTAFRNGDICTLCKEKPLSGIKYSCYKGNSQMSTVLGLASIFHRYHRTVSKNIDRVIYLNDAQGEFLRQAGIPAHLLLKKPNFVPHVPTLSRIENRVKFLFLGRISLEKGIPELQRAWKEAPPGIQLTIVGDGPLIDSVQNLQEGAINARGFISSEELEIVWQETRFLVFPSVWLEGMPMVLLESLSRGVPIIAPMIGGAAEIVHKGIGFPYDGTSSGLRAAICEANNLSTEDYERMVSNCVREHAAKYSPEANWPLLESAYKAAINYYSDKNKCERKS